MQKDPGFGHHSIPMITGTSPSFEHVDSALRHLGAGDGATEAHGSLCGLACVVGPRAPGLWVARLSVTHDDQLAGTEADIAVLGELATSTCAALGQGDMSFAPLLPPDDWLLTSRAEALADWCAGFMRGLGEAAGGRATQAVLNSEPGREIMADFAEIARLALGDDETDLEAESAYSELVEFVRVSVQLLFDEFFDVRQGLASAPMH